MDLNVINNSEYRNNYTKVFKTIFEKTIKTLDLNDDVCVSVIFTNDEDIRVINKDYRNIDRATDVISFALGDNKDEYDYIESELGDIFINMDAATRQAEEYGHSLKREVCFLFTHGLLHLNGFDHMKPEDEKVMIEMQKKILDDIVPR